MVQFVGSRRPGVGLLRVSLLRILAYLFLAVGSVAMVLPFVWLITSAFKPADQINAVPPVWIPRPITLAHFESLFAVINVPRLYANSLFLASLITVIGLYTSVLVGYVLAKHRFPGRDALFLAIIATMMIPWPATMVPVYQVCLKFGLINNWGGIIVPSLFTTFGIYMMRQFMHSIPSELCDAARIDGCTEWGTFHRIVLPNCRSGLGALAIFIFIWHWESFLWPLIVLSDVELYTLPIGMAYFIGRWYRNLGPMLACATIGILPELIVFVAFQSQIVEGVTLTGLKA